MQCNAILWIGYDLNKHEFRDEMQSVLSSVWLENTQHSLCNEKKTVDHILNCKQGRFVAMRHNEVHDFEAELLRDVGIEPELFYLIGNTYTSLGLLLLTKLGLMYPQLGSQSHGKKKKTSFSTQ